MAISEVQSPREGAKTTLTEHPLMLSVNGEQLHAQVMADTPLLLVLRNDLALNGPKYGCGLGECGACTVLIDGVAARSCVIPALGVSGRAIVTLEGLGDRQRPHPVQRAFIEEQAAQCGYCLNGMIMTTKALLIAIPPRARRRSVRRCPATCAAAVPISKSCVRFSAPSFSAAMRTPTPMTDSRPSSPSQAELLQRDGVLLIVDSVQPPSGPVPKGQTPVLKPKEQGLFIALCGSGEIYAFNGHVDLGTGVRTALGQIVAEELYLRMDQVRMVLGDTERAPNQGATIASATLQISAVPLRNAAAEARRWLLRQAAQRFDAPVEQLTLEEGVIRSPQGQALSYAELVAGGHVELSISGDAPLKPQAEYRLVGTSAARVDIPAKATGETTYVHDMRLPNMLHGRVVRPPYAGYDSGEFVGTSLLAVDETSIAHIPGIVKLVVIGDFIGIVAEREEQAIKAAQALQVSWKDWRRNLPQMTDVAQALRDNPHSTRVVHDTGDVDAALAAADRRFTRSYLWPYQLHASIGPSCALADYRPERLQVWSGSQNPHLLRADLAWLLEYPEAQIEIVRMEAAGCYGRNCADDVCADAALLSRAVGRPVRVQLTREQEHVWEPKGTAQLMEVDGGLDAAGHPVAYDFRTYYPSNGAPTLALLLTGRVEPLPVAYEMGDRTSVPPYEYPALRVSIEDMAPIVRASWMRGVSALPNTFAHESYIDELAHAAGVDPLEYRLRYIHDERASELMRSTAERAGWTPHTEPMQTPAEDGVLRGRGFAYARYIHSKFPGFGAAWPPGWPTWLSTKPAAKWW